MRRTRRTHLVRAGFLAVWCALLCALALLATSPLVASADDLGAAGTSAASSSTGSSLTGNPATIPTGSTGSLLVHVYSQPPIPTGIKADGSAADPAVLAGLSPIPGVTFAASQVQGIDLGTNAGWQQVAALEKTFDPGSLGAAPTTVGTYQLGPARSQVSDATGTASFTGLPLGLYLVRAMAAPTDLKDPAGHALSVDLPQPFLVTVPLTGTGGQSWNYNVNVYPKPGLVSARKSVNDEQTVDRQLSTTWRVDSTIALPSNQSWLDGYTVTDALDPRLAYTGDQDVSVSLTDPASGQPLPGVSLRAGRDYTITDPSSSNKHTLTVDFSPAGLRILAAHNLMNVTLRFKTTATASGDIPNTAVVYTDGPGHTQVIRPVTTNTPDEKFGGVQVLKEDASNKKPLTGAKFEVVTRLKSDGSPDMSTAVSLNPAGNSGMTTVGSGAAAASVWTSDGSGLLTIDGLRYSCYSDGRAITGADGRTPCDVSNAGSPAMPHSIRYYLVEVAAPAGYSLIGKPIPFIVDGAATAALAYSVAPFPAQSVAGRLVVNDAALSHTPPPPGHNPPGPPGFLAKTGTPVVLAALFVLGLGAVGLVMALTRRRRRDEED